jgi:hypothetical protein
MADLIKLKNNHKTAEQYVFVNDRRYSLPPDVVDEFPRKVANAFLTERGSFVSMYDTPAGYVKEGEATVWLANNTGNPFESEFIERMFYKGGKEEIEKVPNPLRVPRALHWSLHTGQSFTQGDTAIGFQEISINFPPTRFDLAPYERKPFARIFADRALTRDAFHETGMQRSIIAARAPTSFEPNMTWSLDEIRLFVLLVDSENIPKVTGKVPSESAIRKEGGNVEEKIDACKNLLLRTLFYRLVDDAWPLPSRDYFNAEARNAKLPGFDKAEKAAEA